MCYTMFIIRKPQNPVLIIKAPTVVPWLKNEAGLSGLGS